MAIDESAFPNLQSPIEQSGNALRASTKWWQWILVYPSLAIALLSSVPTITEAYRSHKIGVPFGKSYEADKQNQLWQENFDCTQASQFQSMTNTFNVEIGTTVCITGDVLLRSKAPQKDQFQYQWVSWRDISSGETAAIESTAFLTFVISSADAQVSGNPIPMQLDQQTSILCQRWVSKGVLLRRMSSSQDGCYDEVINTFSGNVISRNPAPCDASC